MIFTRRTYFILLNVLLFSIIGFSSSGISQTSVNEPEKYTQASIITEKSKVTPGDKIRIGLKLDIHPKWHVYWSNPGDSGTPPSIDWELPEGFAVTDLEFPRPKKLPFGPLTNYGHEDQPIFLQTLTVSNNITEETFTLKGTVNLLVCYDICIPESHDISLTLNGSQSASPKEIIGAQFQLPKKQRWNAKYYEEAEDFIIDVPLKNTDLFEAANNYIIFPENWGAIDNSTNTNVQVTETGLRIIHKRGERELSDLEGSLGIVLSYQTDKAIERSIHFTATEKKIKKNNLAAAAKPSIENNSNGNKTGLIKALIFAIIGGLILNLMPCVFPVLSIKALSLINLQSKEEKKARGYGLSYTAGILISFGIIAGALLLLKAGGAQIGWGFQLQSPAIIIMMIYLVFVIGLNFSGLFEFSGKFSNVGSKLAHQSGNKGAFFTGVLATIVATPCTAPFMGAAMGFALTQPPIISLLVFIALGIGLALPYFALCFIPPLRAKLPKPGAWMETFRQFLAFPMFITTAWLMWVLSQQINSIEIFCVLLSLIGIVFIIWMMRTLPGKGIMRLISQFIIILSSILVVSLPFIPKEETGVLEISSENRNWEQFTPDKLKHILENTNDPVFTNMTAAWCITCKVNEKVALSTNTAKEIFKKQKIQYLKGDWTKQNPEMSNIH